MNFITRFLRRNQGSVMVEFAVIFPVMFILFAAVFEFVNYTILNNKLIRVAGVLGDVISRDNLKQSALVKIMGTADSILKPFNYNGAGSLVVSQIRNSGLSTNPLQMIISWQQSKDSAISQIGKIGAYPSGLPSNVSILNDQTLIATEVFYQYKPLIFKGIISDKVLYHFSFYVPRSGTMNALLPE